MIYPPGGPTVDQLGTHLRSGSLLDMIPRRAGATLLDEAEMREWDSGHDVDADVVRELLRGRSVFGEPDPRGLRLRGVRIRGRLDLDRLRSTIALRLTDCLLDQGITAAGACIADLVLVRCRLSHPADSVIGGRDLRVEGSVWVTGCHLAGGGDRPAVDLAGARVSGQLVATGCAVHNPDGPAVVADGLQTGGDVLFDGGFAATGSGQRGTVSLRNARVGGLLSCRAARLRNPCGPALDAEGLSTVGDLVLGGGAIVAGAGGDATVRLVGATVGGRFGYRDAVVRHATDPRCRWAVDGLGYTGVPAGAEPAWDCTAWLQLLRTATAGFAAQPYQQLAAVYRARGCDSEVRTILVAQRRDQLARGALSRRDRRWGHVTGWLLGYGYRSWRVLWGLLGVLAASVLLAMVLGPVGALGRVPDPVVAAPPGTARDAMPGSCTVVETIASVLPEPLAGPRACAATATPAGDALVIATWVLRSLAWALVALFVAGLTGIVGRA